ncbi:MAG TPA: hypothetical protein VEL79_13350 [Vicinamibacterales bacterium]|nr:hypothetical protein [Vicinamibacterales bacterium]
MRRSLGATLIIAALTAACSGKGAAPTAPSNPQGVPAAQGGPSTPGSATIAGSIKNTGAGGTVSIAAGAMSATVDSAGRFTLTNVPAGDVQLQVRTASGSGVVPITGVTAGGSG